MNKVFLHRIAPSCVRDASSFTMWIRFTRALFYKRSLFPVPFEWKQRRCLSLFYLHISTRPVSLRLKQDVI